MSKCGSHIKGIVHPSSDIIYSPSCLILLLLNTKEQILIPSVASELFISFHTMKLNGYQQMFVSSLMFNRRNKLTGREESEC